MNNLKIVTLIIFLFSTELATGQDQGVWMYGWKPAETQELYDYYMDLLYVKKPYLRENYEEDIFNLYSQLQNYKKLSVYCQGKTKDYDKKRNLNIKGVYSAWQEENREFIELINSLWATLVKDIGSAKTRELVDKIEEQNKSILPMFESSEDVGILCKKAYSRFGYEEQTGKIIGRPSEEKRFSNSYRNIDFFLHPEKKEVFKKELKKQLDAGLAREKTCKKSGGEWKPVGLARHMACITKYPDAGKPCTDSSQCKGGCIQISGFDGALIRGACKNSDDPFGCPRYLHKGEPSGAIVCRD